MEQHNKMNIKMTSNSEMKKFLVASHTLMKSTSKISTNQKIVEVISKSNIPVLQTCVALLTLHAGSSTLIAALLFVCHLHALCKSYLGFGDKQAASLLAPGTAGSEEIEA